MQGILLVKMLSNNFPKSVTEAVWEGTQEDDDIKKLTKQCKDYLQTSGERR